nr:MAG TPA: hypothetical protein [Caudoviricetes sp.]
MSKTWSIAESMVFPVYAGVILTNQGRQGLRESVPRVCGGDPCNCPRFCI